MVVEAEIKQLVLNGLWMISKNVDWRATSPRPRLFADRLMECVNSE